MNLFKFKNTYNQLPSSFFSQAMPEKFPNGIQNQNIENYLNTQQHSPNKTNILLCVYPPETEKQKMESYLASLNFLLGENYWYL